MQGVTTALVGFLFVCIVYPKLIKNRTQYYAAFAMVCAIILLDAVGRAIHPTDFAGFAVFAYAACAFLQIGAIVMLLLAAGGLTVHELTSEMQQAFEVMRRGGEDKEVIFPLTPEMQRQKEQRRAERPAQQSAPEKSQDRDPERFVIDDPPAAKPQSPPAGEAGSIPLE